ncbi:MAG: transposase [Deltaproteobacteria bacterium]|nr:transposase [Deltaproteobacteria bacterium]
MLFQLSHKIELNPNNIQEGYFKRACGTARFTYNWALGEWNRQYQEGLKPSALALKKEFNAIKYEEFPWISEVLRDANSQPFTNLGKAFVRFFEGTGKYPVFKKRGIHDSFYIANDKFRLDGNKIKVPKLGWIRMREQLRFTGKILSATVSRIADKWFVAINVQTDLTSATINSHVVVGVDLGVKQLATLSDGTVVEGPKPHKALLQRLRRLNKSLSRKEKGSNNWKKGKLKLSRLHARIANIRKDALHKLTTMLVQNFSIIGIEDLNVNGMTKNHKLARSILDMGFGEFVRQLSYKAKMFAVEIVQADRFFPSSKTCCRCGFKKDNLTLSDRVFGCDNCGLKIDRDLNAAINLEKLAVGSTVTACGEAVRPKQLVRAASVKQEFPFIPANG